MPRRISLAGLILFMAIWSGVFLYRPWRALLQLQIGPRWSTISQTLGGEKSITQLLREYPNDPDILAVAAESRDIYPGSDFWLSAEIARYDKLIARFPKENWLIANRLRDAAFGAPQMKAMEQLSPPLRIPQPSQSSFGKSELERAVNVAEIGCRRDPQNAFYNWMQAAFLFCLGRDREALQALESGSRKSQYNEEVLHWTRAHVRVRALQKPVLFEDELEILSEGLYAQYTLMRSTNAVAVWYGARAEQHGNHQRALQIYGAQMHLCSLLRHYSTSLIGLLVREDMERTVWGALNRRARSGDVTLHSYSREKLQQRTKRWSMLFAGYAQRHGRPDLAMEAKREAANFDALDLQQLAMDGNFWGAIPDSIIRPMLQLNWVQAVILRAVCVSALAWLLLRGGSLILPLQGLRKRHMSLDILCAACFVVIAFVIALPLRDTRINTMMYLWVPELQFGEVRPLPTLIIILMWLPLTLTAAYCATAVLWRARKNRREGELNEVETLCLSTSTKKVLRAIGSVLLAIVGLMLCIWWVEWVGSQSSALDRWSYGLVLLPFITALLIYWLGQTQATRFGWIELSYLLAWCRSTLGVLIVIGSVAYFTCGFFALPLRRDADAHMEDLLSRGEVALMRERMNQK